MKGFSNVISGVIGLIVTIIIAVIIVANLWNVVTSLDLTGDANRTVTNLFNQTWTAFGLFVILPIVLAAVVLLRLIGGWGKGR